MYRQFGVRFYRSLFCPLVWIFKNQILKYILRIKFLCVLKYKILKFLCQETPTKSINECSQWKIETFTPFREIALAGWLFVGSSSSSCCTRCCLFWQRIIYYLQRWTKTGTVKFSQATFLRETSFRVSSLKKYTEQSLLDFPIAALYYALWLQRVSPGDSCLMV